MEANNNYQSENRQLNLNTPKTNTYFEKPTNQPAPIPQPMNQNPFQPVQVPVQPYGQPIMVQPGQQIGGAIIVNQPVPSMVVTNVSNVKVGLSPYSTTCIFCRSPITTVVEKSLNFCSCLLCLWTGLIIYVCIQMFSGKEILCCDAVHKCPNCGNIVGQYTAC